MRRTLTPTQRRMYDLLADGLPHPRDELRRCLYDELGSPRNVHAHLTALRAKLRLRGRDVLCVWDNNRPAYRMVRLLNCPHPGGARRAVLEPPPSEQ